MGNYFSEMNCIKATVITEINNDTSVDEVKKDENIPEEVKQLNPICDNKEECCDIEDCCKNKESCNKESCNKESCNKESCNKESCNKKNCSKADICSKKQKEESVSK